MKNIFRLLSLVLPLVVATSCQEKPEPLPEPVIGFSGEAVEGTTATITVTVENSDKLFYLQTRTDEMDTAVEEYTHERVMAEGKSLTFASKESFSSPQSVQLVLENLTYDFTNVLLVAASNADGAVVEHYLFNIIEEIPKENMPSLGEIAIISLEATKVTFGVPACNVDAVRYAVVPKDIYEANLNGNGLFKATDEYGYTVVEVERTIASVLHSFEVANLTPETNYVVAIIADNADIEMEPVDAATHAEFTTPSAGPAVTMSDIEVLDIVGHSAEFSVTTRYMDNFGFVVVPTAEYEEMTVDYVINNSLEYYWADGNLSWEQDFTFPFNADTKAETDYTVVAVATNAHSSVMKTATFTTPKEEMTVEMLSLSPTSASVVSSGSDHYLTMRTALYELCVHLVSDEFGGRYEPGATTHTFVTEGSYFKELNIDDSWTVYEEMDPTFGNIDLYENVITGKWEIYGSFFFLPSLTVQIEIPNGIAVDGAERTTPAEFNLNIKTASAERDGSNGSLWNLTLAEDESNTITFKIKLDSSKYEFIPSGEYLYDGQGSPCLDGGSMILNNVATTIGKQSVGLSKVTVRYNSTTGESYFDAVAYVKAGTAVAKITNAGPFKLYEEEEQGLEVVKESRNLMIWATWQSSLKAWELNFSGDKFYGYLYLTTGGDDSEYLPEGRYVFSQTAPADGSLWMDCSRSYVARLRTSEELKIKCGESDSYLDVTTTLENGQYMHTIKGVLRTENGFFKIDFDYGVERGSIY